MLGVGWTEMLLIGIVALVVIGPKELPGLMKKLGQFTGQVRRMGQDFQRELNKTTGLDEVRNLRTAITEPLKATTDAIRKEFNTTTSSGTVQPSGAIKPADPKFESVVSEIQKQAGITPAATTTTPATTTATATTPATTPTATPAPVAVAMEPIKGAPVKAATTAAVAAPIAAATPVVASVPGKARRVPKAKAAPTSPVTTTDLFPPETPAPARKPRKPRAVESPAPVEAIAPNGDATPKPKRTRKPASKKAE
jgi:sec-independent protein translocase protein TatB